MLPDIRKIKDFDYLSIAMMDHFYGFEGNALPTIFVDGPKSELNFTFHSNQVGI